MTKVSAWDTELEHAILNTRAWVKQERALSRRILHFGHSQLYWECCELTANEIYPRGCFKDSGIGRRANRTNFAHDLFWNCRLDSLESKNHQLYIEWDHVKLDYARYYISRAADKAVAIAGLAKRFQTALGDEYLFGLWKQGMPHQLLWHIMRDTFQLRHELTPEPRNFLVPSYSWISANSRLSDNVLRFLQNPPDHEVFVEFVSATFPVEGTTGEAWTRIRLCCKRPLVHCNVVFARNGALYAYYANGATLQHSCMRSVEHSEARQIRSTTVFLDRAYKDLEKFDDYLSSLFLPIRHSWTHLESSDTYRQSLEGLLLRRMAGSGSTFQRVGYMCTEHGSHPSEDPLPYDIAVLRGDDQLFATEQQQTNGRGFVESMTFCFEPHVEIC